MAQPPQAPKYRQNGAIRSALACFHAQQKPAVGMIGDRTGFDGFAAKRVRHEHGVPAGEGNAVAAMADMIDDKMFSHGARRGRIRCCRRRL